MPNPDDLDADDQKGADDPGADLGGDYARDTHRGGFGDDYARDGGWSGGGRGDQYTREPDPASPGVPEPEQKNEPGE